MNDDKRMTLEESNELINDKTRFQLAMSALAFLGREAGVNPLDSIIPVHFDDGDVRMVPLGYVMYQVAVGIGSGDEFRRYLLHPLMREEI